MSFEHHIDAQRNTYIGAIKELRAGRKQGHWMWFIFPQLRGLGHSDMADRFGLRNREEARAYAADPILGPRLAESFRAILSRPETNAEQILGAVDAMKLRSCATLFAESRDPEIAPLARQVLIKFHGGSPCPLTLQMLAKD